MQIITARAIILRIHIPAHIAPTAMSGKVIYGLINGISKRVYDADQSMTNEFLHQSLLPDLPFAGLLLPLLLLPRDSPFSRVRGLVREAGEVAAPNCRARHGLCIGL
jgi:hypothetical protein